jgi:hypothetical protein
MLQVNGMAHVILTVSSFDVAHNFYDRLLPLKTEFGWDLGAISGALALRLALFGLVGPAYYQTMSVRPLLAEALE